MDILNSSEPYLGSCNGIITEVNKPFVDFTGFTTGKFSLKISGEFENPNPINDSFENDTFSPGYTILTN